MLTFFRREVSGFWLAAFILIVFAACVSAQNMFRKVNDFDGDGKADYAVTRIENGFKIWYIWQSRDGYSKTPWGLESDVSVAGDYNADGRTDIAVLRSEPVSSYFQHTFYILQSPDNTMIYHWLFTDTPLNYATVHQDYNGDGRMDMAMLQTAGGTGGLIRFNLASPRFANIPNGHFPLRIGDMDGDGRAERSSYNPNTNLVTMRNMQTEIEHSVYFGLPGDAYVPADFDGDGIGDLTVFRPTEGTWWWIRSSDNVVNVANWGVGSSFPYIDTPVPGDYDGDGKTDLAVYRRGTLQSPQSYYWIKGSSSGVSVFAWGTSADSAVGY